MYIWMIGVSNRSISSALLFLFLSILSFNLTILFFSFFCLLTSITFFTDVKLSFFHSFPSAPLLLPFLPFLSFLKYWTSLERKNNPPLSFPLFLSIFAFRPEKRDQKLSNRARYLSPTPGTFLSPSKPIPPPLQHKYPSLFSLFPFDLPPLPHPGAHPTSTLLGWFCIPFLMIYTPFCYNFIFWILLFFCFDWMLLFHCIWGGRFVAWFTVFFWKDCFRLYQSVCQEGWRRTSFCLRGEVPSFFAAFFPLLGIWGRVKRREKRIKGSKENRGRDRDRRERRE